MLNRVPSLGEKLITASSRRRGELLSQMGTLGRARRRTGPLPRHKHGPRVSLQALSFPFHVDFDSETDEGSGACSRR